MEQNRSAIWIFDIIKPFAATLIIFHHYQQVFNCKFSGINFYNGRFTFGYLVELFFMISGFLTLYTFKESVGGSHLFESFCHKLKRVFPIVTIACIYILLVKTFINLGSSSDLSALWNIKALIANFLLLFSGYPYFSMKGFNNPTWYIAILIQCYAIFYILKYIANKLHIRFWVTVSLLLIGVIILYRCSFIQINPFRGYESFFIGVGICDLVINYKNTNTILKVKLFRNRSLILVFLIFVIVVSFCSVIFFPKYQRIALVFGVYPEIVIISFLCRNVMINSKIHSFFKSLCGISFEVYIWHYPLMATFQLISKETSFTINHSYLTMIIFAFIVWIICFFIYHFLEQPINKLLSSQFKHEKKLHH